MSGSPINASYFADLTAEVDGIQTCAELQHFATKVFPSLTAQLTAINAQVAALAPMIALLTAPTSPTEVVTWATSFITHILTPQLAPYLAYPTQLAQLTSAIASLESAISAKASQITHCSVSIP